jgi:lipase chaperone LimK
MDNFDLKKYLAEGKLTEEELEIVNLLDYPYDEVLPHIQKDLKPGYNDDDVIRALISFFKGENKYFNEYREMDSLYKYVDYMKNLAEGELNEEANINQAKNYAQQFMQSFQKMRNVVRGNFGSETEEKFVEEVKEKMKAKLYSND